MSNFDTRIEELIQLYGYSRREAEELCWDEYYDKRREEERDYYE